MLVALSSVFTSTYFQVFSLSINSERLIIFHFVLQGALVDKPLWVHVQGLSNVVNIAALTRRFLAAIFMLSRGTSISLIERVEFSSKLVTVAFQRFQLESPISERDEQELAPMKCVHPLALFGKAFVLAIPVGIFAQKEFLPDKSDSDGKADYHLDNNTDLSDYLLECLLLYAGLRCVRDHRNLKKRSQESRIDEKHCMNQEANIHDVLHVCSHSCVLAIY